MPPKKNLKEELAKERAEERKRGKRAGGDEEGGETKVSNTRDSDDEDAKKANNGPKKLTKKEKLQRAAAAAAAAPTADDHEDDEDEKQTKPVKKGAAAAGGKKGGKGKKKQESDDDDEDDGDVEPEDEEEEEKKPKAKPKKPLAEKKATVMMMSGAKGGVAAATSSSSSSGTSGNATQNACIIVSAGGAGNLRGRRQKWPEYVFLKGTGFSNRSKSNSRDIKIEDFSLQVPGKVLVKNATLTLAYGHKYGLIGRNGIGKSVLLRSLSERDPSTPFGKVPANIRILHVQQEVTGDDRTLLETILAADIERSWLMSEVDRLTAIEQKHRTATTHADDDEDDDEDEDHLSDDEEEGYTITDLYDRLREIDAHKAIPRAMRILTGLGFTDDEIKNKPTKAFSGGWRMRIALAQALFLQPELLILDEPTNHLDLLAVIWLEAYLATWRKTLLLVTHDASFVGSTCDYMIHFHNQTLSQYKGDYWSFLKARQQEVTHLQKQLNKQDKRAEQMKELAGRNTAGKQAKQVKTVLNKYAKEEKVEEEKEEAIPSIVFPDPAPIGLPVLQFREVDFGYEENKPPLFRNLDFGLYMDSRIGLVGPNGAGKSTLIKLISGDLHETKGYVHRNPHLTMARFHQHHVDQLDMNMTPIEYMQSKFTTAQTQEVRGFLGRFGVKGGMALQKIGTLSGGQRSRLAFAELCWKGPQILLLDEPTNHLDMDTIEVLIEAIKEFKGGVVLISHHQRLIEAATKEVWVVQKDMYGCSGVTRFEGGDFDSYKRHIINNMPAVDSDDEDN